MTFRGGVVMGRRSDYKKMDEISTWDLDAGCRGIIDTSTPPRRRLRDRLRRQARKRVDRVLRIWKSAE